MTFWLALQFLTILPTPRVKAVTSASLGGSLAYYPAVGLVIGGVAAGFAYALGLVLPPVVEAVLVVAVLAVVTGAHHLDGLADSCDGLVAGKSRQERLKLMAGSGVGAFGIVGICLVLLLKFAALYQVLDWSSAYILPVAAWQALLFAPVAARWAAVGAIFCFPYARPEGMGLGYKQGVRWYHLLAATVVTSVVAVAFLSWPGLVILAVAAAVMYGVAALFAAKLGGLTGDSYGAIIELSETLVLLLIVVAEVVLG